MVYQIYLTITYKINKLNINILNNSKHQKSYINPFILLSFWHLLYTQIIYNFLLVSTLCCKNKHLNWIYFFLDCFHDYYWSHYYSGLCFYSLILIVLSLFYHIFVVFILVFICPLGIHNYLFYDTPLTHILFSICVTEVNLQLLWAFLEVNRLPLQSGSSGRSWLQK